MNRSKIQEPQERDSKHASLLSPSVNTQLNGAKKKSPPGTNPARRPDFKQAQVPGAHLTTDVGLHARSASSGAEYSDTMSRKRLVDQFYKTEAKSKQRSYTDMARQPFEGKLVEGSGNSSISISKTAKGGTANVFRDAVAGTDRLSLEDSIRYGKVELQPFDDGLMVSTEWAETMVSIGDNWKDVELAEVEEILGVVAEASRRLAVGAGASDSLPSGTRQLAKVESYLARLQNSVDKMLEEVEHEILSSKQHYNEEMEKSVARVEQLRELLHTLTGRVETAKAHINGSKQAFEGHIGERLKLLEYVSARFDEYDHIRRQRRVRQSIVGFSVLVAGVCVYIAVRGFC